jgi:hypothetical protein
MSYSNTPSIRGNAGQKPFYMAGDHVPGAGTVDTVIFTPPADVTYQLTDVSVYSYSGTNSGEWQVNLWDGSIIYVVYEVSSAPTPININALMNIPFESPMVLRIRSSMSVNGHYWASVFGWQWKRGEGALD